MFEKNDASELNVNVCMYVFYSASVYKVSYNRGTLLILTYNYYITQNHCLSTQVYMPYNTYMLVVEVVLTYHN